MSASIFIPAAPASEEDARLLRLRAQQGDGARETEGVNALFVSFMLDGREYVVSATSVQEALTRLGTVTRVAAPDVDVGVAFAGNTPVIVVDLKGLNGRVRPLRELASAPGILLRMEEHPIALAVEPPVAFVEGRLSHKAVVSSEDPGLQLEGRLESGTLVLSGEWLLRWVRERAGATTRG